ncbi:hypothetical protein [Natrononativus amylolyticus]|uniref:hypothetical protein n=1 Tax=Natrononativus amylolyticus TaxID=2963434 RepID=UPI0020CD2E10|nr:hypothetical protein [Natrononativus amylolyticus]
MVGPQSRPGTTDELGFDETRGPVSKFLGKFVPRPIARRAVSVSVRTDREVYDRGEPVDVTVDFKNRLPVGVEIPTPKHRLWGWTVDGELEASDQRRYTRPVPSSFVFQGGERKQVSFVWNGRFERTGRDHRWVLPDPGDHEISVFIATHDDRYRPTDSTTITIRS